MRLDKRISQSLFISRTDAKKCIQKKEVTVNGIIISNSAYHVQADDDVRVVNDNGINDAVTELLPRYFMLHKPMRFVCSSCDDGALTALRLLNEPKVEKLHFAGRLDADTTGLLLLTDDGQWSHRITSSKIGHQKKKSYRKCYAVTLDRPITASAIEQLKNGVLLRSETELTYPAIVYKKDDYHIELILNEGRYHQVKRMIAAVGNHVVALHRFQIGELPLDPNLLEGEYRSLTAEEVALFLD